VSVYVRLRLASETYAIDVEHVVHVAPLGDLTAVPGSPPGMLGVRNLRGQILPVLDLAPLLGVARTGPPTHLVVGQSEGRQVGLAVDEVSGVGELADPTEETQSGLLAGASLAGGELIGIIDMARVFESVAGSRQ
jgi:purine-binding chemotaxis protein CheW